MNYIEGLLTPGEKVIYQTKLHWIVFVWPMVWLLISLLFAAGGHQFAVVARLFFLLFAAMEISAIINYLNSEFGITDKRVIAKTGFIRRSSLEVLLAKVESIKVDQGILGRILNYGSITISGTGGTKDPFRQISSPFEFRKMAQNNIIPS